MIAPTATETPSTWQSSTDLLFCDDIYCWPPPSFASEKRDYFPRVTAACDLLNGDMKFAEYWWIAEYVKLLSDVATDQTRKPSERTVQVWVKDAAQMFDVKAADVLCNNLDADVFGKNGAMHWIKLAGSREMTRRANRGTVVHDCIEDFALKDMRVDDSDLEDYLAMLIQGHGFTIQPEFCVEHARQALKWCDNHLGEVFLSECPVFSFTNRHAGTLDLVCTIRNYDTIDPTLKFLVDAKNSKQPSQSHRLQAAAYFYSEKRGVKGTNILLDLPQSDRAANLYIQPEGCVLKEWHNLPNAYKHFLHLLCVWYDLRRKEMPKTVKLVAPKLPKPSSKEMAQLALTLVEGDVK